MSFDATKEFADYGDTVILYTGYDRMLSFILEDGKTHQTKYGAVKHASLVGKRYGTRVQCANGWIYMLHPTPELWTLCLPHRTQILYTTDISMVIFNLDLRPGCKVAEAGTGSGSLSHALIRSILPTGHLYTFEYHQERSEKAREEFSQHHLSDYVTVTHRDVCGEGFQLDHCVDAVFLDLPKPWECIKSAKDAIKKEGGRICTFSPCIEQVQRSCEELIRNGFTDLTTVECLTRKFNVQNAKLPNILLEDPLPAAEQHSCDVSDVKKMKAEITASPSDSKSEKTNGSLKTHCFSAAAPVITMPGHTGFLTFASVFPV
ncbi:tRNA (adenine(58)-N(1))-methyltransferase catalytic subunit TRMT61A-like [Physella acuta]|uniref:tRNA (adenine(58)-N(1))-methyltransferase catalytic subunit TRMT61A-like n=1 Tax=Physella acuta TaxID=109671 RepID=UPI0027DAB91A|nr:tRNA (adenine(58)-N(1))-methyltransferase catalytic subunit TRMT61A-like [Physella acuta]